MLRAVINKQPWVKGGEEEPIEVDDGSMREKFYLEGYERKKGSKRGDNLTPKK